MKAYDGSLQQEVYTMEALRKELYTYFAGFTPNVYYQPPASMTLLYPCIIFSRSAIDQRVANDFNYILTQEWSVMCISIDPEWSVPKSLLESTTRRLGYDRNYIADNLYHTVLTLNTHY